MMRTFCLAMALLPIHSSSSLTAQEPQVLHHDDLAQVTLFDARTTME
jgi:hypothetical protein